MDSIALLYTAVFLFYAAMEVMGMMPQEMQSAGGTLSYMFASFYGDQVSSQYSRRERFSTKSYFTPRNSTL